jgi:hypothetical protein
MNSTPSTTSNVMTNAAFVTISCENFKENRAIFFQKGKYPSFLDFKKDVCALYNENVIVIPSLLDSVGIVYTYQGNVFRVVNEDTWQVAEMLLQEGLTSALFITGLAKRGDTTLPSNPRQHLDSYRRLPLEWRDAAAHSQLHAWRVLNTASRLNYRTLLARVEMVTGTKDYVVNPNRLSCPICAHVYVARRICDSKGSCIFARQNSHLATVHLKGEERDLAELLISRMTTAIEGDDLEPLEDEVHRRLAPPPARVGKAFLPHVVVE